MGDPVRVLLEECAGIWGDAVERTEVSDSVCRGEADSERELTPEVVEAEFTALMELPAATLIRPCASRSWMVTGLRIVGGESSVLVVVVTVVCCLVG